MPSENQAETPKPVLTGIQEADLDKKINEMLNKFDSTIMESGLDEIVTIVFARSKFDKEETLVAKTVMALRKAESNTIDNSEALMLMLMFAFKKLGFKEDAVRAFIAEQIKKEHPEVESVDDALNQLLSPLSPK